MSYLDYVARDAQGAAPLPNASVAASIPVVHAAAEPSQAELGAPEREGEAETFAESSVAAEPGLPAPAPLPSAGLFAPVAVPAPAPRANLVVDLGEPELRRPNLAFSAEIEPTSATEPSVSPAAPAVPPLSAEPDRTRAVPITIAAEREEPSRHARVESNGPSVLTASPEPLGVQESGLTAPPSDVRLLPTPEVPNAAGRAGGVKLPATPESVDRKRPRSAQEAAPRLELPSASPPVTAAPRPVAPVITPVVVPVVRVQHGPAFQALPSQVPKLPPEPAREYRSALVPKPEHREAVEGLAAAASAKKAVTPARLPDSTLAREVEMASPRATGSVPSAALPARAAHATTALPARPTPASAPSGTTMPAPEHPTRQLVPRLVIGQIDIVVEAPPPRAVPRQPEANSGTGDLASRLYLRRI